MRLVDGAKLRQIRKNRGISAMDVAHASALNVTYLYKLEVGEHRITEDTARRLGLTLKVGLEEFSTHLEVESCDAVKLAHRLGFSRIRAYQFLGEGRVPGAYKEGENWVIPDVENVEIAKGEARGAPVGA